MAEKKTTTRKKPVKAVAKKSEPETQSTPHTQVHKASKQYAVGRRKRAITRLYWHASPNFSLQVNAKDYTQYFAYHELQTIVLMPFTLTAQHEGSWNAIVRGGGKKGQAESVRLAIARIFSAKYPETRPVLKKAGLLRRDARIKERKKYGLKRARRAPQWQKR